MFVPKKERGWEVSMTLIKHLPVRFRLPKDSSKPSSCRWWADSSQSLGPVQYDYKGWWHIMPAVHPACARTWPSFSLLHEESQGSRRPHSNSHEDAHPITGLERNRLCCNIDLYHGGLYFRLTFSPSLSCRTQDCRLLSDFVTSRTPIMDVLWFIDQMGLRTLFATSDQVLILVLIMTECTESPYTRDIPPMLLIPKPCQSTNSHTPGKRIFRGRMWITWIVSKILLVSDFLFPFLDEAFLSRLRGMSRFHLD